MSGETAKDKQGRVCAWPGCGISLTMDLGPWDDLLGKKCNWLLAKMCLHDPSTDKDYCPMHWHWQGDRRVPGPEEES